MSRSPSHDAWTLLLKHLLDDGVLDNLPPDAKLGVLRAEAHAGWVRLARHPHIASIQFQTTFKPHVNALVQLGMTVVPELTGEFDLMLWVPTKQRKESLACLAEAMDRCPQGYLLAACANDMGAVTYEKQMRRLVGGVGSFSKAHCRVFWSVPGAKPDPAVAARWREDAAPARIPDTNFHTLPGIYGWNKIDRGSMLLAECLPDDLADTGMDLGANYGYLSHALLSRPNAVRTLHLLEAEARALDCARENLSRFTDVALRFHWQDINESLPEGLDFVLVNPPFHAGKEIDYDLGRRFVEVAVKALRPRGRLFLVANQFLSYEEVLEKALKRHERVAQRDGFKVLIGEK